MSPTGELFLLLFGLVALIVIMAIFVKDDEPKKQAVVSGLATPVIKIRIF